MNTQELRAVLESMERERGIDRAALIQMVEAALLTASRKSVVGPARDLRIKIDEKTLAIRAYAKMKVVEQVSARNVEISLADALKIKPDAQIDDWLEVEMSTQDFGRIAAQTA